MPPQSYPQQQPRQQQQQQQQQRQQQQQQEQQQEQQQQHRGNQHRGNDTERYETRGSLDALVDAALDTPLDQQRQLRQQPPLSAPKVETSNVRSGMSISSLLQLMTSNARMSSIALTTSLSLQLRTCLDHILHGRQIPYNVATGEILAKTTPLTMKTPAHFKHAHVCTNTRMSSLRRLILLRSNNSTMPTITTHILPMAI
ncbi:hypothetical protein DFQ27_000405 [Actinomortierella ambigua]|uniref:Uncharacterized protein n=1 Tax=Actinomortierella ambigua TaxID=1343610 RepID=A0A9P6UD71_9FUNG|nr:hypothetical protein DFQ27_000405 [Actinomortierella ambigua]